MNIEEIMRQQQQEHNKDMKIIKEKSNLVRDMVQRRMCVVVFWVKERNLPMKIARENEVKRAKEIEEIVEQIEEVYRIGKYDENGTRPMKIRFTSQTAVEHVLQRTGKLTKIEEMKEIWIKRDMNEEERSKLKKLRVEAQSKNEERTQEQARRFVWKVVDMKVRKWCHKDATQDDQAEV